MKEQWLPHLYLSTFLAAKEKTWKHVFNTNSESSQNRTEKQIMSLKQQ